MPKPQTQQEILQCAMSEADLLEAIIDLAHILGWKVAHFRPGMTSRKSKSGQPVWVTPVQGDGAGFPDLVLVRERVLYWECKSQKGILSEAQKEWGQRLLQAKQDYRVVRPKDWLSGRVEEWLR